ncbi:MAG: HAMP domain-containing protein [Calditrichaeota bacterium]|nr:MAG: HAMP domain-containing protein [Calditrichota bacterium]
MKLQQKLIGSFMIVAAICFVIGIVGWIGIANVNSSLDEVGNKRLPAVEALLTIDAVIGDVAKNEMELLNPLVKTSEAQQFYAEIDERFAEVSEESKQFQTVIMNNNEKKLFTDFQTAFEQFAAANNEFLEYSKKLDETGIRNPAQVKYDIKNIESAHRGWILLLSETVVEGYEFKGQLDPTKCALGQWIESYDLENEVIKEAFTTVKSYHDDLHKSGETIQDIFAQGTGAIQKKKAKQVFEDVSIPSMNQIIAILQNTMQPEADKSSAYYDKMIEIEESALNPTFNNMIAVLDNLVTDIKQGAKESQEAGDNAVTFADTLIIISIIIGVLLAVGFGLFIARMISKPISQMAKCAEGIALGDVNQDIGKIKSKDEVGMLAKSFENLIAYIQELAGISEAIAKNDLTRTVTPKSENDVLGNSFKLMNTNLRAMIADLTTNTNELVSAATEIASSSEQMSRGAEEQTNQVNQVSTAVEEMAATIVESSKNASEASESSSSASKTATDGGQIVSDTISGMQNIASTVRQSAESITKLSQSADQIGEIIAVIDDIADQTNLLALNAAIEAARAGEQGRGFAVVADEVRKLAERTGKATSEITDMIQGIQSQTEEAVQSMESGIQEVDKGRELTDKAGNSLSEIVTMSELVMNMIQQIATASEEQSTAAEQISQNIESIATVTRETSTGAQQSAAAAEQLNRQAEGLKTMVEQFKI